MSGEDPALQLVSMKAHIKYDIDRIVDYYKKNKDSE